MANWNNPTITTQYDVFVNEMKDRDIDSGTMFLSAPTNPVAGMVRFNRTSKIFEEYNGTAWVALIIGVAGGGTGAGTGAGAGTSLGLGSMAYQNSNAINVTGGSATGLTVLTPAANVIPAANNTYDIGSNAAKWKNGYFQSGLVVPVGVDKFVVG